MIADPREFPAPGSAPPDAAALYELADACLAAQTGRDAAALEGKIRSALEHRLRNDGEALAATLAGAPSVAVARLLWRTLDAAWRDATLAAGSGVALTVFALPLVVVAGMEGSGGEGVVPGVLADATALGAILMEAGALSGSRTVALANVLAGAEALDIVTLPQWLAMQSLPDAAASAGAPFAHGVAPSPLAIRAGTEGAHLRFLVGTAVARPGADLLAEAVVGKWGMALTRELARQLGSSGVPVLAMPRAPQNPLRAVQQGRAAQREVAAQLFASNAIRRLRARVGEPVAVVSAHRAAGAPGGGELRLSLSSPLEPREAEGFRCPLDALDRVEDVVGLLRDLMRDCRVTDVRVLGGVHPDRDPATGLPLLFKPGTLPDGDAGTVH